MFSQQKLIVECNCGIEAENHFLLESLAAFHNAESKLVMHFMVNTAFINYLDNLTDSTNFVELDYTWKDLTHFFTIFWFWSCFTESIKNIKGSCSAVLA